jgi:hypothetical protein
LSAAVPTFRERGATFRREIRVAQRLHNMPFGGATPGTNTAPVPAMQPRQASNEDRPGKSHDPGASASSPWKRASLPTLLSSFFRNNPLIAI